MSGYSIRDITQADIGAVVLFSSFMAEEFTYELDFNAQVFSNYLAIFIASPTNFAVLLENDGLVCGYILVFADVNIYSGKAQCTKATWVVSKKAAGYGKRLLKAAEQWAKASFGDVTMCASAPNNRVADLLQTMGYEAKEVMMDKKLWQ
jgi:GNAT superfamily N-acetyltransferase